MFDAFPLGFGHNFMNRSIDPSINPSSHPCRTTTIGAAHLEILRWENSDHVGKLFTMATYYRFDGQNPGELAGIH